MCEYVGFCVRTLICIKGYESVQIHYRNACSAELYMLVVEVRNIRDRGQILAYQLSQNTRARTVQDPHSRDTHENGIVDKIGHGTDGLVTSHTTDVDVLFEVQLTVVDHVAGVLRGIAVGTYNVGIAFLTVPLETGRAFPLRRQ